MYILSAISLFPSFRRISPCITQLEEQWQDLDLTSWQIQGCRTTTPVLWFNKPCHLRSPVLSSHKHLPQIDRLGKSVTFLFISPFFWIQHLHAVQDVVLLVLHLILPAYSKNHFSIHSCGKTAITRHLLQTRHFDSAGTERSTCRKVLLSPMEKKKKKKFAYSQSSCSCNCSKQADAEFQKLIIPLFSAGVLGVGTWCVWRGLPGKKPSSLG